MAETAPLPDMVDLKARCDQLAASLQYAVSMRGVSQFDFDSWYANAQKLLAGEKADQQQLVDGLTAQVKTQAEALKTLRQRCERLESECAMWQRGARAFEETIDAIREALGQQATHYLVMPDDVADVVALVDRAEGFLGDWLTAALLTETTDPVALDHRARAKALLDALRANKKARAESR